MNALGFPDYAIIGTPSGGQEAEVTFNSNTPDAFGSYYFLDGEVIGWDSPDMRMTMLTKIGNDVNAEGEIPADLHYRGRSIQVVLFVECTSEENRENSKLLLAQACNTSAVTFAANEVVPKFLSVVRGGNTSQGKLTMVDQGTTRKEAATQPVSGGPWGVPVGTYIYPFKATVELYAQDPFKYAVTPTEVSLDSGVASFDNPGTYPTMKASLTLTSTGSPSTLTISTDERALLLGVPAVPPGAPTLSPIPADFIIDFYNQTIKDGAGSNYYYLRDMQTPWLRIPTGTGLALTVSPATAGTLTFYPAWL